jgi:LacI family transcriptional regulator
MRFRETIQKSVHDVLIEARLERVQELLSQTTLSLDQVAERCGFRYPEYMSSILKQRTGWSPARFRREFGKK